MVSVKEGALCSPRHMKEWQVGVEGDCDHGYLGRGEATWGCHLGPEQNVASLKLRRGNLCLGDCLFHSQSSEDLLTLLLHWGLGKH